MRTPQPFLYEPKGYPVTAAEAADLVTHEGAHCHQFDVNPDYESPDLALLQAMADALRLQPEDGESWLLLRTINEALDAARQGRYGVAAILGTTRRGVIDVLECARNQRVKGNPDEFIGHAEVQLVKRATPYLQSGADHSQDLACVNLCPCPGCFGHMIDAHFPTVVIGTIDPHVGAAFLKGERLELAAGRARKQVMEKRGLVYRFPHIPDSQLRDTLLTLSWDAFHATRKVTHRALHQVELKE